MNAREFHEYILKHQPVVKFNDSFEVWFESGFDVNMKARAVTSEDKGDGSFKVTFDFTEFEKYNYPLQKSNWFDEKGMPTLRWSETNMYPNNKLESVYFDYDSNVLDYLEIVDDPKNQQEDSEEVRALRWVVEQFEKVLADERDAEVFAALSHAKTVLSKYSSNKGEKFT